MGPAGWAAPLYDRVLDAGGAGPGTRILDLGCGAGGFAAAAVARGAQVHGLDTDPGAVAWATREVPGGRFTVGDAHDLGILGPVDLAAAVQLIAHVTNPVQVLREAARVAPGGVVAVTVWGDEQECDVRMFGAALTPWLPPRPRPTGGPAPVTDPDRLRRLAELAGLTGGELTEVVCPFRYPDDDALVAPLFDTAIGRHAVNRGGPAAVRAAVLDRMADRRLPDGSYRLDNLFRVLVTRAT